MRNVIDSFLSIFRNPTDLHRVVVSCFLAVFASHFFYLHFSAMKTPKVDLLLQSLVGSMYCFVAFWAVFSAKFDLTLYVRLFVVAGWGVLGHRLFYGVESFGSAFFNIMLFLGWSVWIPFALTGMRFDQLQLKIEEIQKRKEVKKNNGNNVVDYKEIKNA